MIDKGSCECDPILPLIFQLTWNDVQLKSRAKKKKPWDSYGLCGTKPWQSMFDVLKQALT